MRIDKVTLGNSDTTIRADCDGMEIIQSDGRVFISYEDLREINRLARLVDPAVPEKPARSPAPLSGLR